jgi:hypothetical protein
MDPVFPGVMVVICDRRLNLGILGVPSRDEVAAVGREQRQPLFKSSLVQKARLSVEQCLDLGAGRGPGAFRDFRRQGLGG